MKTIEQMIRNNSYWSASVFHQWEEGRGSRKFTNAGLASIDGKFPTEGEAMAATQAGIAKRNVRTRGHYINYSRAKPSVSFHLDRDIIQEIGRLLDLRTQPAAPSPARSAAEQPAAGTTKEGK